MDPQRPGCRRQCPGRDAGRAVRVVSGFSPLTGDLEYRQAGIGGGTAIQDLAYDWDAAGNLSARRDLNQGPARGIPLRRARPPRPVSPERRRQSRTRLRPDRQHPPQVRRLQRDGALLHLSRCAQARGRLRGRAQVRLRRQRKHDEPRGQGHCVEQPTTCRSRSRAAAATAATSPMDPTATGGGRPRATGPATETTTYAGGLFEKVTSAGQTTWRHYVPAPGGTAVHLRHGNGAAAETRFLTLDHLGSTDSVVDAEETPSSRKASGPSAPGAGRSGRASQRRPTSRRSRRHARRFHRPRDARQPRASIHMNGRVYDPVIGRFISADPYVTLPYDGQGLNRYAYTLNNPLAFTDPSGFDPVPCLATQSGNCVQITVIAAYPGPSTCARSAARMRAKSRARSSAIPAARTAAARLLMLPAFAYVAPSSIVLTVGRQPRSDTVALAAGSTPCRDSRRASPISRSARRRSRCCSGLTRISSISASRRSDAGRAGSDAGKRRISSRRRGGRSPKRGRH